MAWTEITDRDICVQGEDFKYNAMASGTIKAGQGVSLLDTGGADYIYVISSALTSGYPQDFFGIAGINACKGSSISVYGQGAICWTRADAAVTTGDILHVDNDGEFDDCSTSDLAAASGVAQALTTQGTAAGLVKVKLIR